MERRRRRPSRSALALRWLAAASVVVIGLASVHPLRSCLDAKEDVAARRAEVRELEGAKRELSQRLELAGSDAFVEREARRLGLVRPGERLFIVKGVERWKERRIR